MASVVTRSYSSAAGIQGFSNGVDRTNHWAGQAAVMATAEPAGDIVTRMCQEARHLLPSADQASARITSSANDSVRCVTGEKSTRSGRLPGRGAGRDDRVCSERTPGPAAAGPRRIALPPPGNAMDRHATGRDPVVDEQ
jgi:hypothetical protein